MLKTKWILLIILSFVLLILFMFSAGFAQDVCDDSEYQYAISGDDPFDFDRYDTDGIGHPLYCADIETLRRDLERFTVVREYAECLEYQATMVNCYQRQADYRPFCNYDAYMSAITERPQFSYMEDRNIFWMDVDGTADLIWRFVVIDDYVSCLTERGVVK